jgi:hypothetical protein
MTNVPISVCYPLMRHLAAVSVTRTTVVASQRCLQVALILLNNGPKASEL